MKPISTYLKFFDLLVDRGTDIIDAPLKGILNRGTRRTVLTAEALRLTELALPSFVTVIRRCVVYFARVGADSENADSWTGSSLCN